MRLTDEELQTELNTAKNYLLEVQARKSKQPVIVRATLQVEILEELMLWRENGRKWLNFMNSRPTALSDVMFAGKGETNGQVQQLKKGLNKTRT